MSGGPNKAIYGEIARLVPIHIGTLTFQVPEGIPLIRAFQYIQFELGRMTCDWSRFCFNDTIGCCHFEYQDPDADEPDWGRACCQRVVADLEVHTLPKSAVLLDENGVPLPDIPAAEPQAPEVRKLRGRNKERTA